MFNAQELFEDALFLKGGVPIEKIVAARKPNGVGYADELLDAAFNLFSLTC